MSKYIFENVDKLKFRDCRAEDREAIVSALIGGIYTVEYLAEPSSEWLTCRDDSGAVFRKIYRVLENPYTLEDALNDIKLCSNAEWLDDAVIECGNILRKFAKSNGVDK